MKVYNVNQYNGNIGYMGTPLKKAPNISQISQTALERLGLNIETLVGYTGPKKRVPPPKDLPEGIYRYLESLQVDWRAHVTDVNKRTSSLWSE